MYLVRIGYKTINLEYLIEAADSALGAPATEAPDGGIRVLIYPGKIFDVGGWDATKLRLHIEDNLEPPPEKPGGEGGSHGPPTRRVSRSRLVPTPVAKGEGGTAPVSSKPRDEKSGASPSETD